MLTQRLLDDELQRKVAVTGETKKSVRLLFIRLSAFFYRIKQRVPMGYRFHVFQPCACIQSTLLLAIRVIDYSRHDEADEQTSNAVF